MQTTTSRGRQINYVETCRLEVQIKHTRVQLKIDMYNILLKTLKHDDKYIVWRDKVRR